MAFDTETLEELGVSADVAAKIIDAHNQAITGNYIPKTRFDEVNKALKQSKSDIADRDTQIASLKTFEGDNESLKAKVSELQAKNEEAAAKYAHEMDTMRKTTAIRGLLSDAQDIDMVIGLLDLNSITVDASGRMIGAKEQIDGLRERKPFLFRGSQSPTIGDGAKPGEGHAPSVKAVNMSEYGKRLAEARNVGAKQSKASADYYFPRH